MTTRIEGQEEWSVGQRVASRSACISRARPSRLATNCGPLFGTAGPVVAARGAPNHAFSEDSVS